jgi:broad specificity phosphatase PhoE
MWRRNITRAVGALAFVTSAAVVPARVGAQPSMVVLVRHGEKQPTPADDPSLSEAGVARAQALADALAQTKPSTIIVSARKRTAETAAVVAKNTGVTPTVIALDATHVKSVADAVMKAKGVVLVVGHSNTVPAIVNALGGPKLADLCDASYATMFIVTPAANGQPTQVVRASYGTPDGPLPPACTGMTAK